MSTLKDLELEFNDPTNLTYLESMTDEWNLLREIYMKSDRKKAVPQTNTFKLVKKAVDAIMSKNGIEKYGIVPVSFAETCGGDCFEINLAVNYTENDELQTFVVELLAEY